MRAARSNRVKNAITAETLLKTIDTLGARDERQAA